MYLQRFRDNLAGFPEGEVVPNESPDFLVKARSKRIGIELVEYHIREQDEGWGSPMRAQEGAEDRVLRIACEQHQAKSLPPVAVHVLWHPGQAFSRRRVQELATDLADLVEVHLPGPGDETAIGPRRHPAWRSLPREVASLRVDRRINFKRNSWTTVRGGFVPTVAPSELQQIIREKEAKLPAYRRQCQEVSLLVVARGFEPSTFGDLGPEAQAHGFETGFDRVFFLHHANGYVAELRAGSAHLGR